VSQFLRENPGTYSHYVLLDHQDWLAWHAPAALAEEWGLILANSRPGTRILMRSAGLDLSFVPSEVRARLRFFPERTEPLHVTDRVGTYGSLHLAEVR
jgi:S-adenosylmethionine-diacylglycerol 3-amino-3-carboxypropyl transferase